LAFIAASLEQEGHDIQVVDAVTMAPKTKTKYLRGYLVGATYAEIIERFSPETEIVGITVTFTHEWISAVRLIELIREALPNVVIVLGGEHITSMPEFCLATSKADYLVLGEGERTIIELVSAIQGKHDPAKIGGIVWRDGASIIVNKRRGRNDELDNIANPAWKHFDLKTYNERNFVGGVDVSAFTVPILATRGCPYQCTYCSSPNMWTPRWIPRNPIDVVDEIESLMDTYGANNFPFQDLTAIIDKKWVITFCQEIIRRNLKFTWQLPTGTRSEAIDDEVSELLAKTGLVTMGYAPESGSQNTRDIIKKKITEEKLFESIKAVISHDINVSIFFVLGFPHDSESVLAENISFIRKVRALGVSDITVCYFMALPGTELFFSLYDSGKIILTPEYMCQSLHASNLYPAVTYNNSMSKLRLFFWKMKMYWVFYGEKSPNEKKGGLLKSLWKIVRGLFPGHHELRLQTAVRNGIQSAWDTLLVQFRPRWLSRKLEHELYRDWDNIYRQIRENQLALGNQMKAPEDTTKLKDVNVIHALRRSHGDVIRYEEPKTSDYKPVAN